MTVVREKLDFPNHSKGIPCITLTPPFLSIGNPLVTNEWAFKAFLEVLILHCVLLKPQAYTLASSMTSFFFFFWLQCWGARLQPRGEFHVRMSTSFIHILQGFLLTFSDCVSEYRVSTALRTVKFSIYPQARKRHRSLQCKITSGFDSDLEELWNEEI